MTKNEKVMLLTEEKVKKYFGKKYTSVSIGTLAHELLPKIIDFYLQAQEEVEKEMKKERFTEKAKDYPGVGWFPGDCCD